MEGFINFYPLSSKTDGLIERLTFRLCPLFIMIIAPMSPSIPNATKMPLIVAVAILGNAILYGALAWLVSLPFIAARRFMRT